MSIPTNEIRPLTDIISQVQDPNIRAAAEVLQARELVLVRAFVGGVESLVFALPTCSETQPVYLHLCKWGEVQPRALFMVKNEGGFEMVRDGDRLVHLLNATDVQGLGIREGRQISLYSELEAGGRVILIDPQSGLFGVFTQEMMG